MKYRTPTTKSSLATAAAVALLSLSAAQQQQQQECTRTISANGYPAPSLASGWAAHIVANNFTKPRSLKRDDNGHLLVVDQAEDGGGITRLTLEGEGPCVVVADRKQIIANGSLNHGIELSPDNTILYASSQEAVYAWAYDSQTGDVTGEARRVINLGGNGSHSTRTLLLPPNDPDFLLVSWGSNGNVDSQARDPSTGYSTVKAFNVTDTSRVWDYASEGLRVGYGLRNSVGLTQNPVTGGLFSNENNVDELSRDGVEIVEDNPAEELNFHGYLNGTSSPNFGAYYGYPDCFPAWDAEAIPNNNNNNNNDNAIITGQQFAANFNASIDDAWCRSNTINPTLSFTAHMAPMDMEFNSAASTLYITFRGSWNRANPAGYKLAAIPFDTATGLPTARPDSRAGYVEIMANEDESRCPDGCFRPVGLEWSGGREMLFMAADASGEVYVVYRADGSSVDEFRVAEMNGTASGGANERMGGGDGAAGPATPPSGESGARNLSAGQWWALVVIGFVGAYCS